MERFAASAAQDRAARRLSGQRIRLLRLLCEGHHYETAAAIMGASINSVGFHVRNLYTRLGVHSETEAVVRAFAEDLVRYSVERHEERLLS